MNALLLAAVLCSIHFRSGHAQVSLSRVGEVKVCARVVYRYHLLTLSLTCTAQHSALWSMSGFGEGLDDQTRVPAVNIAGSSLRVTTTDTSTRTNPSSITLMNFTYGDHGATVTCEDSLSTGGQSVTISVGPPNCTVSLTASRVTADSAVVRWIIHSCLGIMPTSNALFWYPVGKETSADYGTFINASTNQYKITGLSPNTNYLIRLLGMERDSCGFALYQTGLVDTIMPKTVCAFDAMRGTFGLAAVTVVLFLLLLLLTTILVIVCIKSKLNAAATKKKSGGSGGGGGLELSTKDDSPYKEMNPTPDGINVDMNPA